MCSLFLLNSTKIFAKYPLAFYQGGKISNTMISRNGKIAYIVKGSPLMMSPFSTSKAKLDFSNKSEEKIWQTTIQKGTDSNDGTNIPKENPQATLIGEGILINPLEDSGKRGGGAAEKPKDNIEKQVIINVAIKTPNEQQQNKGDGSPYCSTGSEEDKKKSDNSLCSTEAEDKKKLEKEANVQSSSCEATSSSSIGSDKADSKKSPDQGVSKESTQPQTSVQTPPSSQTPSQAADASLSKVKEYYMEFERLLYLFLAGSIDAYNAALVSNELKLIKLTYNKLSAWVKLQFNEKIAKNPTVQHKWGEFMQNVEKARQEGKAK